MGARSKRVDAKPVVLIADDESGVRLALRRELEAEFSVLTADGYEDALRVFDEHPEIELVATDHGFAEEPDGTELLRRIRDKRPDVFRVMVSGSIEQYHGAYLLLTGVAHDYIRKPPDCFQVRDVVAKRLLEDDSATAAQSQGSSSPGRDGDSGEQNAFAVLSERSKVSP